MRLIKAELESTLVCYLRPHFLSIEEVEGTIHIIVCHPKFKNMDNLARIRLVFSLFKTYNEKVAKTHNIVVEAYDSDQFQELLEVLL